MTVNNVLECIIILDVRFLRLLLTSIAAKLSYKVFPRIIIQEAVNETLNRFKGLPQ